MSKKKIVLITILILVLIIAILIYMGIKNINKDDVKEIPIDNETNTSQEIKTPNEGKDNTNNSNNSESTEDVEDEIVSMSQEEYEQFTMEMHLGGNRHLMASPTYKFKSDDFETIPKDSEWFDDNIAIYISYELPGGPDVREHLYKYINSIEVYNLKDTKTNFIIVSLDEKTVIYQMYKSESTEKLVYEQFDDEGKTDEYVKLIKEKGNKIYSKKNPSSLDMGGW